MHVYSQRGKYKKIARCWRRLTTRRALQFISSLGASILPLFLLSLPTTYSTLSFHPFPRSFFLLTSASAPSLYFRPLFLSLFPPLASGRYLLDFCHVASSCEEDSNVFEKKKKKIEISGIFKTMYTH